MHFVNDIHLEAAAGGRVLGVVQYLAHIVYAGMGRRIQFHQVNVTPTINFRASATNAARRGSNTGRAVQGLGENARNRRFSYTASPGEQISVMQAILRQRIA